MACRSGFRQATRRLQGHRRERGVQELLKTNGYTWDPKFGDEMEKELAAYDGKFRDVIKFLDDDK
jgi:hypothetical protein